MKTQALLLSVSLALAGLGSAHAQISRPVAHGAVLGAIAGALVGGHNHDRWGEGAVIGAAAGALIGAVVDQTAPRVAVSPAPCAQPATQVVYVQQPQPARVVYVQQPPRARVVYVPAPVRAPKVVVVEEPRYRRRAGQVVYVAPVTPRW